MVFWTFISPPLRTTQTGLSMVSKPVIPLLVDQHIVSEVITT